MDIITIGINIICGEDESVINTSKFNSDIAIQYRIDMNRIMKFLFIDYIKNYILSNITTKF